MALCEILQFYGFSLVYWLSCRLNQTPWGNRLSLVIHLLFFPDNLSNFILGVTFISRWNTTHYDKLSCVCAFSPSSMHLITLLWLSDHPEGIVPHSCCWIHGYCKAERVISHNTDPNQNVLVSCWPNCALSWLSPFFKETVVLPKALSSSPVISIFRFHTKYI